MQRTRSQHEHDARPEPSPGALVKEIGADLSDLVGKEVELAKIEIGDGITQKLAGARMLAAAGVAAVMGLVFVLLALRDALARMMPIWAADLATVAVIAAVGLPVVVAARRKLATTIDPAITKKTVGDDVEWAKEVTTRARDRARGKGVS